MAGIDPTRDAEYLRAKFQDITRRMADLESGKLLALVAALTNTPYTVIRTGMFIPTCEDVPGDGELLPGGFFWSEGSEVSRVVYSALWIKMGSPNTGDGSTSFNLINTTDRAPFGAGTDLTLGQALGSGANHPHGLDADGAHDHGGSTGANLQTAVDRATGGLGTAAQGHQHAMPSGGSHNHSGATNNARVGGFGVKWLVKI